MLVQLRICRPPALPATSRAARSEHEPPQARQPVPGADQSRVGVDDGVTGQKIEVVGDAAWQAVRHFVGYNLQLVDYESPPRSEAGHAERPASPRQRESAGGVRAALSLLAALVLTGRSRSAWMSPPARRSTSPLRCSRDDRSPPLGSSRPRWPWPCR